MADQAFELYKLQVEDLREARRARRESSDQFLSINITTLLSMSLASDRLPYQAFAAICAFLLMVTLLWISSNRSHDGTLRAKTEVVWRLEEGLVDHAGARPLADEWRILHSRYRIRWFSFDRAIPTLFAVGYVVVIARAVPGVASFFFQLGSWARGMVGLPT